MIVLAPSVLAAHWGTLNTELDVCVKNGIQHLHFDIMDGHFVPNISFGEKLVSDVRKSFPSVFFDVHLMVTNPLRYVSTCADAGANAVTFHVEEENFFYRTVQAIQNQNMKVGIACNPKTSIAIIQELLPYVDIVLVMSVEPGFGGQAFIPSSLRKIIQLHEIRLREQLNFRISVDGGINGENAGAIVDAGADILVMGSAFFSCSTHEKTSLTNAVQNMSRT